MTAAREKMSSSAAAAAAAVVEVEWGWVFGAVCQVWMTAEAVVAVMGVGEEEGGRCEVCGRGGGRGRGGEVGEGNWLDVAVGLVGEVGMGWGVVVMLGGGGA